MKKIYIFALLFPLYLFAVEPELKIAVVSDIHEKVIGAILHKKLSIKNL